VGFWVFRPRKDPETSLNINRSQVELITTIMEHIIANNLGDTPDGRKYGVVI